jgi:thiamine biosynthesis protein ThiS
MQLTVNGVPETHDLPDPSLAALMERKRWSFPLIIARINGELVERPAYASTLLREGDVVELYHLVSGG